MVTQDVFLKTEARRQHYWNSQSAVALSASPAEIHPVLPACANDLLRWRLLPLGFSEEMPDDQGDRGCDRACSGAEPQRDRVSRVRLQRHGHRHSFAEVQPVKAPASIPVILQALLKSRRHSPVRIASSIAYIDVGAIPARNRMAAVTIASTAAVVIALQRLLFLRGQIAIRIAPAVSGTDIPSVTARRRMPGNAVILDRLDRGFGTGGECSLTRDQCGDQGSNNHRTPSKGAD